VPSARNSSNETGRSGCAIPRTSGKVSRPAVMNSSSPVGATRRIRQQRDRRRRIAVRQRAFAADLDARVPRCPRLDLGKGALRRRCALVDDRDAIAELVGLLDRVRRQPNCPLLATEFLKPDAAPLGIVSVRQYDRAMAGVMIVTGGSRGIGAATAKLAAERGYAVGVNYRTKRDAAEQVVRDIISAGGRAIAIGADVASESEVERLFATVDAELGVLSALVNNAGILERQTRVDAIDAARLDRIFATNVRGAFVCAREAVRRMSTARGGRGGAIVNVSSRAAQLGAPGEYVDYAASKAALDALTIGLAREVAAEGIRVNGVRPGIIYTEIHADGGEPGRVDRLGPTLPIQRGGHAIEVARAILWLLSEEASYSTGTFIDVAGGR
jgi:NAD(P)-dependent dehydrogenase (short-subunit alcohol dehydrogenase family)